MDCGRISGTSPLVCLPNFERLKAYVTKEKRYTVTLKEENKE
jgi:hypothetical protein